MTAHLDYEETDNYLHMMVLSIIKESKSLPAITPYAWPVSNRIQLRLLHKHTYLNNHNLCIHNTYLAYRNKVPQEMFDYRYNT
jgi:hypothetical protein